MQIVNPIAFAFEQRLVVDVRVTDDDVVLVRQHLAGLPETSGNL
jgi:hypothetical protein